MTAPTEQEITEAIEAAYKDRGRLGGSPMQEIESAVTAWTSDLTRLLWQRWPCDDEKCPARPAWDHRLDALQYDSDLQSSLEMECVDLIRRRLREMVLAFSAEHPEATRAPTKPLVRAGA